MNKWERKKNVFRIIKPILFLATVLIFCNSWRTIQASEMIEIPAGPFQSGSPDDGDLKTIELEQFFIDRFEITNQEFGGWSENHNFYPGTEAHPATKVTWQEANDYCASQNKRLPSSNEWEEAARGLDGRVYPWGNKKLKKKAHPFHSGIVKRKVGLNKKDVSYFGVRDMAGSVWEWTSSNRENQKIIRGGLWNLHLDYEYGKTFDSALASAERRFIFLGFRCAR